MLLDMPTRKMPRQKPHRSEQTVRTPREFLAAVQNRFGRLEFDLAANHKTSVFGAFYYGPGSIYGRDALTERWGDRPFFFWLNPPYSRIGLWAAKCARDRHPEGRIALLVPASVGAKWFALYVAGKARVLFLRPRLTFVGHKHAYPKDLMLAVYGEEPGYECWRWKGAD